MNFVGIAKILTLLTLTNGSPLIAKRIFGNNLCRPVDGGRKFIDGRPIFGSSKTIRGLLISIAAATVVAPRLGLKLSVGLLAATAAMAGDLFSSFSKRRLNLAPSSRATGLDQIPESLLPLLACRNALGLTNLDIMVALTSFVVGEVVLSRLLFAVDLRDRPY
jgi:CDP-2,3-bis-(O-geranylgeranyl)-sn-glycerol synthase